VLTISLSPRQQLWHVHVFRLARRVGFEVLPTNTGEEVEEMRTYALLMQEPLVLARRATPRRAR